MTYSYAATCGNTIVEPGEECDDGNTDDYDLCTNNCTLRCLPGTSDDNPVNCECYTRVDGLTGSDLWDESGMLCCDLTDCWLSDDKTWICDNGKRIDGNVFCEEATACGQTWYWNKTMWAHKLPDGCDCDDDNDCESGQCITGVCLVPRNPDVSFTSDDSTVKLGFTIHGVVSVKNNIAIEDTINIKIYGTPEKIIYWAKFSNGGQEINVRLKPHEEKLIPIEIFAGEIGTYKLTAFAESTQVSTLYTRDEQTVRIIQKEDGFTSRSPGLKLLSLILTIMAAGIISAKKNH